MTTISLAKLRVNLSSVIKQLVKKNERYIVEKDEIPVGVLINYHDYKNMIEELEDYALMSDPEVAKRIRQAEKEYKEGKGRPFEEFVKELGL